MDKLKIMAEIYRLGEHNRTLRRLQREFGALPGTPGDDRRALLGDLYAQERDNLAQINLLKKDIAGE